MAEPFRWGIAGYGWVARDYMAPGIAAAGGRVVAVADPAQDARAAAGAAGAEAYPDVADMIANEELEAVYIATPNHLHAEAIAQVAAAGVAILCEKPLGQDCASTQQIAQTVARSAVRMGTAFDQRHHPAHGIVREMIANGKLGTLTAIRIVYCCWVDPEWSRGTGTNWRTDPSCAGGGAVLDLAPHGLDLAEYLLDEPVGMLAMTLQRRVHAYDVEDGGVIVGRTGSGILVSSHTSYNWPEELPRRRLEIAGTAGMIVASDTMGQEAGGHMTFIDATNGTSQPVHFDTCAAPFTRQAAAFQDFVRHGGNAFSIDRDIDAALRFFTAYEKAVACL